MAVGSCMNESATFFTIVADFWKSGFSFPFSESLIIPFVAVQPAIIGTRADIAYARAIIAYFYPGWMSKWQALI